MTQHVDWSKLKAFVDDKINVNEKLKFCLGRDRNIVWEKDKMLIFSIFSLSHNVFESPLIFRLVKIHDCVIKS